MARPTKLTPELCDKIIEHIKAGNYPSTAACISGISESAFYKWMEWGRKRKSGKYVEFMEAIVAAEKFAEAYHIQQVRKSAEKGNVRASQWWLSHKFPEHWADKTKVDVKHTGEVKQEIGGELKLNVYDRIKEYEQRLQRSRESGPVDGDGDGQ